MKTQTAAMHLINRGLHTCFDIIALQEPYLNKLANTRANFHWHVIYPTTKFEDSSRVRSVILVNKRLRTNDWDQIPLENNDITAITIRGTFGAINIFNIYNDCTHSDTVTFLHEYFITNETSYRRQHNRYMIWLGDFNRHHAMWELPTNSHMCTGKGEREAQSLIDLISDNNMDMALPAGLYTLRHKANHHVLTRPDNVFVSMNVTPHIESCTVDYSNKGPGADHFPIITTILLPLTRIVELEPRRNLKEVDWEAFRGDLKDLRRARTRHALNSPANVNEALKELDDDIQNTIRKNAEWSEPTPWSKRWWNKTLSALRRRSKKAERNAHRYRYLPNHEAHQEAKDADKEYSDAIKKAKEEHWDDFIHKLDNETMWTALKFATSPGTNGGRTRIPTLQTMDAEGSTILKHDDNDAKADLFAKTFFPPKSEEPLVPDDAEYPEPCCELPRITTRQVKRQIRRLKPNKAPGPDGITNLVIKECEDILAPILRDILQACLDLEISPDKALESTTAVIRKPGRSDYTQAKSYRPIALLNTLTKVMSAAIANALSYIAEQYNLLPQRHFGGRPGRTTTDALQYAITRIKDAWARGHMVGVLFLDIEAAFPNADPDMLIHNLKKRSVPTKIIGFIQSMLRGRKTTLKFDDYESDKRTLTNGIGQGCPLSMILYIFYNADFLEIPQSKNEDAGGFVDDSMVLGIGHTEDDVQDILKDMMQRDGGGLSWCKGHNSKLSLPKTVYLLITRKRIPNPDRTSKQKTVPMPRKAITIDGKVIEASQHAKYLGIYVDHELRWKEQTSRAVKKAMDYTLAYRRLTRTIKGASMHIMRQLYNSVIMPKILYAADVWITPLEKKPNAKKTTGSVAAIRRLSSVQRIATIAITGAIRSTATNVLEAHANVLPMHLSIKRTCFMATLRYATLADPHPIAPIIRRIAKVNRAGHNSPLHHLLKLFPELDPIKMEKIPAISDEPWSPPPTQIKIDNNREAAIERANRRPASAMFRVFTDGSGIDGNAGAPAVLFCDDYEVATLRYCLGPLAEHTVYEAEAVAATLGLHLLNTRTPSKLPAFGTTEIGIDNHAVIRAKHDESPHSGSHLLKRIREHADIVKRKMYNSKRLRMVWTPGHENIHGNERADEEAKEAAHGDTSDKKELPIYLRKKPLPHNKSAVAQAFDKRIKEEWRQECEKSHRFERILAIDNSLPSRSFLKYTKGCNRAQTSMLMQLRTARIGLNRHLHQLHQAQEPYCPHCPEEEETVRHFLIECGYYTKIRQPVRMALRRDWRKLDSWLSDKNKRQAVLTYIAKTKRFHSTFNGKDLMKKIETSEKGKTREKEKER
jgi:ribonuclease HI